MRKKELGKSEKGKASGGGDRLRRTERGAGLETYLTNDLSLVQTGETSGSVFLLRSTGIVGRIAEKLDLAGRRVCADANLHIAAE
jgi:hypothetical protein